MEISSIPEAFQTSLRIAILSALISGTKTFKDLKQITGATDGNLGAQLRKLEEFEYITVNKNFVKRKHTRGNPRCHRDNFEKQTEYGKHSRTEI